jgi:hypothetical protein
MIKTILAAAALILAVGPATGAMAADAVDVALVLVADVSRSIDDSEFALQKQGYDGAFRDKAILAAIHAGAHGAIAVSYVEFASEDEVERVVGWTIVRDDATAAAFADRISKAQRSFTGVTSISAGVDFAVKSFADLPAKATRRVIDVSGDGVNNSGRDPEMSRDEAVRLGITINGLAIINERAENPMRGHVQPPGGLPDYYRRNVAGGPGSFVVEVGNFQAIGGAIARKLVTEIAALDTRLLSAE